MKQLALTLSLALSTSYLAVSQCCEFNTALNCNINAMDDDPDYDLDFRREIIDASFRVRLINNEDDEDGESGCSATLINRGTSDADVGFYLLTANHCIQNLDLDQTHTLYFNYQSPNAVTTSTPNSNQGDVDRQSAFPLGGDDDGFQYFHQTRLRLVAKYWWGDFALLEILTPIPPHFNFTYSGWNCSKFYDGIAPQDPFIDPKYRFEGVHHPTGDIKKVSMADRVIWAENPIATGCYTITTVINTLFGWIWGNSVSTSVICNYVDNPWMSTGFWKHGVVEGGSSGSGIFNRNNRLIGLLTGGPYSSCTFPGPDPYGKFHANYFNQSVKNTLNPSHNVGIDLVGLGSRKIRCYDNLVLPGAPNVSGEYFPANQYQSENQIVLSSRSNITTTQPIHVYAGADYTFHAAQTIDLGPNFVVDPGATFVAEIGECAGGREADPTAVARERLRQINLPKKLTYVAPDSVVFAKNGDGFSMSLSPNPNTGTFKLQSAIEGRYNVQIMDVIGRVVHTSTFKGAQATVIAPEISAGAYLVEITDGRQTRQLKMIVQ